MQGFPIDPVNKQPAVARWQLTQDNLLTDDKALQEYVDKVNACGFVLKNVLVIDVDAHRGGIEALERLSIDIDYNIFKECPTCVRSGYNGFHYYFKFLTLPQGVKIRRSLNNYSGLEFKTDQIIAPGSKILKKYYEKKFGKENLPPHVGEYWYVKGSVFSLINIPQKLLKLLIYDISTVKNVKINEPLKKFHTLNPKNFREYDQWISLLFAVKEAGISFDDFNTWCEQDTKYNTQFHKDSRYTQWIAAKGNGITPLTLDYFFRENGGHLTDVIDNNLILEDVKDKENNTVTDRSNFKDWIFVEAQEKFYNIRGHYFNSITTLQKTLSYCLGEQKVFDLVNMGQLSRCVGLAFQPHAGQFLEKDGYRYFNMWRPALLKAVENPVDLFIDFMKHFWPTDYKYAIEWMAAIAQKIRPRYMLLIHSAENQIGKSSIIGEIMRRICGKHNSVSLKEKHIHSDYNGYLSHAHLVLIEEMHAGSAKLQFYNVIKEMITENQIMLNEKYEKSFMIDNHAVFLAFTNYFDAMMAKEKDPRVLFLSTFQKPLPREKYNQIHAWLKNGGYENVYHYLLNYKLNSSEFSHAPDTLAKNRLADAVKCENEIFLEEYIFHKSDNFSEEFICFAMIKEKMSRKSVSYKRLRMILINKGYQKIVVSINNEKHRVYVSCLAFNNAKKNKMSINQYIRSKWEAMKKKYEDFF